MTVLQRPKNILYEIQQACIQLNLPAPTAVFPANNDETSLLMGSVANLAGIMTNEAYNWQMMIGSFPCVGDNVKKKFDLPGDIVKFVDQTGWSSSKRRPVVILNAQQWAAIKAWLSQSFFINPACRIIDDKLEFMSAPAVGETVTFEYISSNWVMDGADPLITKDMVTSDTDVPKFDWLLMVLAIKTKYLETKGLDTAAAQSDFNDRIMQLTQNDTMAPVLLLNGQVSGGFRYLDNFYNSPDTNIGF
jgi:hypothetical protein